MRILHVARYGSVKGGAETYIAAACRGLRAAGHVVALAYGTDPDDARPEVAGGYGIPTLTQPGGAPDGRALSDAIERFVPDLVHVHVPDLPWVAATAARHAPVLLAVHDHILNCPVGTKYWAAWKRACTVAPGPWCLGYNVVAHCGSLKANVTLRPYRIWRGANAGARPHAIQVFSAHMRDALARAGLDPARIGVTPYPVPPLAAPRPVDDDDPRPVVFAAGRLNKEKGFHQLIDALAHVRTPAHLVIAGSGHERAALEHRAATAPGGHRVTFLGWASPQALSGWYERAALVVVPSMWPEPFGIVGLEAMAHARAVVAFDSGGIREWLTDGENGRLIPAGDVGGLGRAVDTLLTDPERRSAFGYAGASRAQREFSLAAHIDRLMALYREACE